jgi:hypothetical protein
MTPEELDSAIADMRHGDDRPVRAILAHFEPILKAAVRRLSPTVDAKLQPKVDAELEDFGRTYLHNLVYEMPVKPDGTGGSLRLRREPVKKPEAWIKKCLVFSYLKMLEKRESKAVCEMGTVHRAAPHDDGKPFVPYTFNMSDVEYVEPESTYSIQSHRRQTLCRQMLLAKQDVMLERALSWGSCFQQRVMAQLLFTQDPQQILQTLALPRPGEEKKKSGISEKQVIAAVRQLYFDQRPAGHHRKRAA